MTHVFISYDRSDQKYAAVLAGLLRDHGIAVWWDVNLRAGDSFGSLIEQALADSLAVVVLWSSSSVNSRWVIAEAEVAVAMGKLIPFSCDSTPPPMQFRGLQTPNIAALLESGDEASRRIVLDSIVPRVSRAVADWRAPADVTGPVKSTKPWIAYLALSLATFSVAMGLVPDRSVPPTHPVAGLPVGTVAAFPGDEELIPENWRLCDGSEVLRVEFNELFTVIGTRYGGSGERMFKLPNYQGYFLRGLDKAGEIDRDRNGGERTVGSLQNDAIAGHVHPVTVTGENPPHAYTDYTVTEWGTPNNENDEKASGGKGYKEEENSQRQTVPPGRLTLKGTSDLNESHQSETRPKNVTVNWIIRVK